MTVTQRHVRFEFAPQQVPSRTISGREQAD